MIWLLAAAWAAEPVVAVGDDAWVEGHVDIAATPEAVYAVISVPTEVARIDGSVTVRTQASGECTAVHTVIEHPLAAAEYDSLSCPDGELAVSQSLVGGDMKEFASRWWVTAEGEGARLHYRVRTIPDLFVPQFLVNRSSAKSVDRMLGRLRDHLESPAAK
ncbi:MAG: hypothetical protein EP330_07700 [Deltaproteobacteria bacterium]|nr:MAG: hypothetical protein EP330_07700 [Deltaproteobacteria bacterium]